MTECSLTLMKATSRLTGVPRDLYNFVVLMNFHRSPRNSNNFWMTIASAI